MRVVCVNNKGIEEYVTVGKVYDVLKEFSSFYSLENDFGNKASISKSFFEKMECDSKNKKQPISLLGVMNTWEELTFPSDDIANQIGGTHYNKNDPIKFARDNYPLEQLEGFFRINVDKYVARYDKKNGLEDLKKAKHYLDMLISLKEQQNAK